MINPLPNSGIYIGCRRSEVATRYKAEYSEFFRTPSSTLATGRVGDSIFLVYDDQGCVELIEIADPMTISRPSVCVPFSLDFYAFNEFVGSVPHRVPEEGVYVINSLGVVVTFDPDDASGGPKIISVAKPGYFDYML